MWPTVADLNPWKWSVRVYLCVVIGLTLGICLAEAWFVFDAIPHLIDGWTLLFEAKIFATGSLSAEAPPLPAFFTGGHVALTPHEWAGILPWGFPIVLVPSVWLGVPWIVNPVLAAACVPVLYKVARYWFSDGVARLAVLLLPLSSWFTLMSGTFMTHTLSALLALLAWWGALRLVRTGRWSAAVHTALAVGFYPICRPYSAFAICLPMGAYVAWGWLRHRKPTHAQVGLMAGILAVAVVIVLAMLRFMAPRPDAIHGQFYYEPVNTVLGFSWKPETGQKRIISEPYTPREGWSQLRTQVRDTYAHFLGSPWPGLWLALVPVVALPWTRHRGDVFALLWALCLPIAHFIFYWNDSIYGARYIFASVPALCLLTARGAYLSCAACRRIAGERTARAAAFLAAFAALAVILGRTYPTYIARYSGDYIGPRDYLRPYVRNLHKAIIFLQSNHFEGMSGWILTYDDPRLQGDIILAHDRGHENHDLARLYPGYETYRYTIYFAGDLISSHVVHTEFTHIDTAAELQAAIKAEEHSPTSSGDGPSSP